MDDSRVLICSFCAYSTKRRYNLQRHTKMVHGHEILDGEHGQQNVNPGQQNVNLRCSSCTKCFDQLWRLKRHMQNCKGDATLTCPNCSVVLSCRQAKSRHMKHCKAHPKEVVICTDAPPQHHVIASQTNHITTTNYTTNIVNNNIQVNVINNFEEEDLSHITPHLIHNWLMQKDGVGMFNFFKHVHLNLEHPQNNNIREHPLRRMVEVKKEGEWVVADCQDTLDKALRKYRCQMIARSGDPEFKEKMGDNDELLGLLQNHLDFGATNTPNDFYKIMRMFCAELINFARQQKRHQASETSSSTPANL